MKKLILAVALALLPICAQAQSITGTALSGAAANATLQQINVIPGAGGGAPNGTLNTNVTGSTSSWIFGGTPSMGATSYDACTQYFSLSALVAGINIPIDKLVCWDIRVVNEVAKFPPGTLQYAVLCVNSRTLTMIDWETGIMGCTGNKAKLADSDVRKHMTRYSTVVFHAQGTQIQNQQVPLQTAPPTGAPVAAPTFSSQAPTVIAAAAPVGPCGSAGVARTITQRDGSQMITCN